MAWNINPFRRKKDSKVVEDKLPEVEKSIRIKFLEELKRYEDDYGISQRTIGQSVNDEKRIEFLSALFAKLPGFKHKELVKEIFNNSPKHFSKTSENFAIMEGSSRNSTSSRLKSFGSAQKENSKLIEENIPLSQDASRFLLKNDEFDKALEAVTKSDFPIKMLISYCKLSALEKEYFVEISGLGEKFAIDAKKKDAPESKTNTAISDAPRLKYLGIYNRFKDSYRVQWSEAPERNNNITMIISGLEYFTHSPDYVSIYNKEYKSNVDHVLNYEHFISIFNLLNVMDESIKFSENNDIAEFDKAKREIKLMIDKEEEVGRAITKALISSDGVFKKSIETRLTKEAAEIFSLFSALSIAEKEYYESLCVVRNKFA